MIVSRRPDVERFLKDPPAGLRAALIYGRDRGQVCERAEALAARVTERPDDPFDVGRLTEPDIEADPGRLADELAAQSLAGGRRLVRLRLTEGRVGAERAAAEALKDHDKGLHNPDAFFLVEAGALGRDSALRRAAEAAPSAAALPCYEDEPGDVARLVRETLAKDRLSLSPDALELFVQRLPRERGVARQEIERLALYLGPGGAAAAKAEELEPFFGVEPEASLADAAEAAFGGQVAAAHAALRRAAAEGEGGPAAIRAISLHLARLRRALVSVQGGASPAEAAKAAGVFWRNERVFLRQARAWTLTELDALQPEVLAADRGAKQTGAPDRLIAERLALAVAVRARRLGL